MMETEILSEPFADFRTPVNAVNPSKYN